MPACTKAWSTSTNVVPGSGLALQGLLVHLHMLWTGCSHQQGQTLTTARTEAWETTTTLCPSADLPSKGEWQVSSSSCHTRSTRLKKVSTDSAVSCRGLPITCVHGRISKPAAEPVPVAGSACTDDNGSAALQPSTCWWKEVSTGEPCPCIVISVQQASLLGACCIYNPVTWPAHGGGAVWQQIPFKSCPRRQAAGVQPSRGMRRPLHSCKLSAPILAART